MVLLALTTNSPFWQGNDAGYASYRIEVFDRWPTTGTLPALGSRSELEALVEELLATGVVRDAGALYWDVRPSARYPTLEFRVATCAPPSTRQSCSPAWSVRWCAPVTAR